MEAGAEGAADGVVHIGDSHNGQPHDVKMICIEKSGNNLKVIN